MVARECDAIKFMTDERLDAQHSRDSQWRNLMSSEKFAHDKVCKNAAIKNCLL